MSFAPPLTPTNATTSDNHDPVATVIDGPTYLDSAAGELSLFRAMINYRPIGVDKHWNMLGIISHLKHHLSINHLTNGDILAHEANEPGNDSVQLHDHAPANSGSIVLNLTNEDIWNKYRQLYDEDTLWSTWEGEQLDIIDQTTFVDDHPSLTGPASPRDDTNDNRNSNKDINDNGANTHTNQAGENEQSAEANEDREGAASGTRRNKARSAITHKDESGRHSSPPVTEDRGHEPEESPSPDPTVVWTAYRFPRREFSLVRPPRYLSEHPRANADLFAALSTHVAQRAVERRQEAEASGRDAPDSPTPDAPVVEFDIDVPTEDEDDVDSARDRDEDDGDETATEGPRGGISRKRRGSAASVAGGTTAAALSKKRKGRTSAGTAAAASSPPASKNASARVNVKKRGASAANLRQGPGGLSSPKKRRLKGAEGSHPAGGVSSGAGGEAGGGASASGSIAGNDGASVLGADDSELSELDDDDDEHAAEGSEEDDEGVNREQSDGRRNRKVGGRRRMKDSDNEDDDQSGEDQDDQDEDDDEEGGEEDHDDVDDGTTASRASDNEEYEEHPTGIGGRRRSRQTDLSLATASANATPTTATTSRARRRTTRSASVPTSDDRASSVLSAVDAKREKAKLAMRAKRAKQKELKEAKEAASAGAGGATPAPADKKGHKDGGDETSGAARRGERSKGRKRN